MSLLSDVTRFIFGTGWWIAWHVLFLLLGALFAIVPLAMISGDALKQPPPTASLGTFGCVMMIALFLGATAPVAAGAALRASGCGMGATTALALIAGAVLCIASFWLLARMAEHGGRTLVALTWAVLIVAMVGHLAALRWAVATEKSRESHAAGSDPVPLSHHP